MNNNRYKEPGTNDKVLHDGDPNPNFMQYKCTKSMKAILDHQDKKCNCRQTALEASIHASPQSYQFPAIPEVSEDRRVRTSQPTCHDTYKSWDIFSQLEATLPAFEAFRPNDENGLPLYEMPSGTKIEFELRDGWKAVATTQDCDVPSVRLYNQFGRYEDFIPQGTIFMHRVSEYGPHSETFYCIEEVLATDVSYGYTRTSVVLEVFSRWLYQVIPDLIPAPEDQNLEITLN